MQSNKRAVPARAVAPGRAQAPPGAATMLIGACWHGACFTWPVTPHIHWTVK